MTLNKKLIPERLKEERDKAGLSEWDVMCYLNWNDKPPSLMAEIEAGQSEMPFLYLYMLSFLYDINVFDFARYE